MEQRPLEKPQSANGTTTSGRAHPAHRIRVGVLDPNELLCEGLIALLSRDDAFDCAGAWSRTDDALAQIAEAMPDVMLVDAKLPERAGFHVLSDLAARHPGIRVIMMVDCSEEQCVVLNPQTARLQGKAAPAVAQAFSPPDDCLQVALKMGAQGVVRKQCSFRYIAQAIRTVCTGQYWMELPTATRLAQQYLQSLQPAASEAPGERSLTLRERQVISLIAHGRSNKEIAHEMQLAYSTVKNYVSSILEKLELSDRTQIALYAVDYPYASNEQTA